MPKKFVITPNYNRITQALDLQRTMIGDYRPIIIVSGGFGTGKTQCLLHLSAQHGFYYVRAEVAMTVKSLLCEIAVSCDIAVEKSATITDIKDILKSHFDDNEKPLLIDEADFVLPQSLIETLRMLVDSSNASLLLAGMADFEKRLGIYPHLLDRSPNPSFRIRLGRINQESLQDLIAEHYAIPFTDDAVISILARAKGKYRGTLWILDQAASAAARSGLERVTEDIIEAIK